MSNSRSARIMLVSDDEQLRSLLCGLLVAHGYDGVVGLDSQRALTGERLRAAWEVVIVDVSVSGADAMRVLGRIESTSASTVVIFGKKNGAPPNELAGDVQLGKPFDPRELLLIVRGMLDDQAGAAEAPSEATVSVGPIALSPLLSSAIVAQREIELTGVETRLLHELLRNAAQPVSRERLTRRGLMRDWSPDDRSLDTHINRLRQKLGNDHRGRTPIRTVTGVGYLLLADWKPAD